MVRATRARSHVDTGWRLLTPLLALALVLTAMAVAPHAAAADTSAVAAVRARQLDAEAAMRRADKQIARLLRERQHHARLLRQARHSLQQAKKQLGSTRKRAQRLHGRLDRLELTLARETRVRPDPRGRQLTDKPALRRQIRGLRTTVRLADQRQAKAERKVARTRALVQSRQKRPTLERLAKRRLERERSEARLSAAIGVMASLSRARAGRLGAAAAVRLRTPVAGRVSQPYGCTGYRLNPSRGGCRHFHDGVDIAAPKGRMVRAPADGFVSYAGFSPWDSERRAFIVIIEHARGYQTVHAHLQPTRLVRAGERVRQGQPIGRVGMTGTTTGPHLHWEAHRGGRTIDPRKVGR